jgi:hypothetical protein
LAPLVTISARLLNSGLPERERTLGKISDLHFKRGLQLASANRTAQKLSGGELHRSGEQEYRALLI